MNDLFKIQLFSLLTRSSQEVSNSEMQNAYGDFIAHIAPFSQTENDLKSIIRKLNITRAELVFYGTSRGKNALKFAYFQKALSFLESEIDLLKLTFLQLNRHPNNTQSDKPKVYFIPNSQGLGIDSMGEFTVSFELSHQFVDEADKHVPFIHITQALEMPINPRLEYSSENRIT